MAGKHPGRERKRCLEILGLSETATEDEIKKAYKKLALKFHPDKNDSADAKEKFQEISYAHKYLIEGPSSIGGDHPGEGDGIPMDILARLFPWILQDMGYFPSYGGGMYGSGLLEEVFGVPRRRSPFPFFMDSSDDYHSALFMEDYDDDPVIFSFSSHGNTNTRRQRRQGGRSHFLFVNRNNSAYSNLSDPRTSNKKSSNSSNKSTNYSSESYSSYDGGIFSQSTSDHNSGGTTTVQNENESWQNYDDINVRLPPRGKKKKKKKKKKETEETLVEQKQNNDSQPNDSNMNVSDECKGRQPTEMEDKETDDQPTAEPEPQIPKRLNKKERRKLQREQARKAMGLDHTSVMKEAESRKKQGPVSVKDLGEDEDDTLDDTLDDSTDDDSDDNSDKLETKSGERMSRRMRKNQKRKQRPEEVEPMVESAEFDSNFFPSQTVNSSTDNYQHLHPQTFAEEEEMIKLALEMSKADGKGPERNEKNESFKSINSTPHSKPTYVPVLNSKLPSLDQLSLKKSQDIKQGVFEEVNKDRGEEEVDDCIDKTLFGKTNCGSSRNDSQFYEVQGKVDVNVIEDIVRKKSSDKGTASWHDSIGQTPFFKDSQGDSSDTWEFTKTYYNKGQRSSPMYNFTDAYGNLNSDNDSYEYSNRGSDYFDNSKAFDIYENERQRDHIPHGHQGQSSTKPGQHFPVMSRENSKDEHSSEEYQKESSDPLDQYGKTITEQDSDMYFQHPHSQYYFSGPSSFSMTGQRSRPHTASKEPYMNSYNNSGSGARSPFTRDQQDAKTMERTTKPYSTGSDSHDNQNQSSGSQYFSTKTFPAPSEYVHTNKTSHEPPYNVIFEKDETGKPLLHREDQFHNKEKYFSQRNNDSGKQFIPIPDLSRKYDTQSPKYMDITGKQYPKTGFTINCEGSSVRNGDIDSGKSQMDLLDSIDDPAIMTSSQQSPTKTRPYGNGPYRPNISGHSTQTYSSSPSSNNKYGRYGNNNSSHNIQGTYNPFKTKSQPGNFESTQYNREYSKTLPKGNNLDDIDDVDICVDSCSSGRSNGVSVDLRDGLHIPQGIQMDQARKVYQKK